VSSRLAPRPVEPACSRVVHGRAPFPRSFCRELVLRDPKVSEPRTVARPASADRIVVESACRSPRRWCMRAPAARFCPFETIPTCVRRCADFLTSLSRLGYRAPAPSQLAILSPRCGSASSFRRSVRSPRVRRSRTSPHHRRTAALVAPFGGRWLVRLGRLLRVDLAARAREDPNRHRRLASWFPRIRSSLRPPRSAAGF
jgi:hypothetical protein